MKKILLFIISIILLFIITFPENQDVDEKKGQEYHFKKTMWGMSKLEVKKSEKAEFFKDTAEILAFKDSLLGNKCLLAYYFDNEKLFKVRYLFIQKHSNKNDFIYDYNELKNALEKKYKQPKTEKKFWKNKLYKNDYSDWGLAISIGHLTYLTNWKFSPTKITLYLFGDNYKINLWLEYEDINYKPTKNIDEDKL